MRKELKQRDVVYVFDEETGYTSRQVDRDYSNLEEDTIISLDEGCCECFAHEIIDINNISNIEVVLSKIHLLDEQRDEIISKINNNSKLSFDELAKLFEVRCDWKDICDDDELYFDLHTDLGIWTILSKEWMIKNEKDYDMPFIKVSPYVELYEGDSYLGIYNFDKLLNGDLTNKEFDSLTWRGKDIAIELGFEYTNELKTK